jgi:integrase
MAFPDHQPKPEHKDGSFYVHRFAHRGRSYTIFKRVNSKSAPYYIRLQRGKKRYKQSLETSIQLPAVDRAKLYIDSIFEQKWEIIAQVKARHHVATLEQVLEIYRRSHGIARRSAMNNELAMLSIFKRTRSKEPDPKLIRLDAVNKNLAIEYQDLTAAEYCKSQEDAAAYREARDRAYRSSRSTINQARSIFSRRADNDMIARYKEAGLVIPECVINFLEVRLRGRPTKREYNQPDDAVIEETFKKIEQFAEDDPDVYRAFWLAVGAGLRRGEIQRVRWEHFVARDGIMWISGGIGKDGQQIEVPIQDKAWKKLESKEKTGFVLRTRHLWWAKRLNAWMRGLGWNTEKKMHELRSYVGSLIYRKSPQAAMKFMRHKSIKVTEEYYVRYGADAAPVNVL